jgi:hypothetical protein
MFLQLWLNGIVALHGESSFPVSGFALMNQFMLRSENYKPVQRDLEIFLSLFNGIAQLKRGGDMSAIGHVSNLPIRLLLLSRYTNEVLSTLFTAGIMIKFC